MNTFYLLRVDRTPREGVMFPRQEINLLDLSRAIVAVCQGVEPRRMWTDVKGRHDHDAAQRVRADVRAAKGRTIQRSVTYIRTDDKYR